MYRTPLFLSLFLMLSIIFIKPLHARDTLWPVQSIDTMKQSRDRAREPQVLEKIPAYMQIIADLGATHVAIGTPYDEEFVPVLTAWVKTARERNLKVWFRGNTAGWEGWFGYSKLTSTEQHHAIVKNLISKYPELFENGDVFTPAPEPENGFIGDPRFSTTLQNFENFLTTSYQNCQQAFKLIRKSVSCGYFSTNGDVARLLDRQTIEQSGGVFTIDHYVKSPEKFLADLKNYHKQVNLPLGIGEFGVPVPNLHGSLSPEEQARLAQEFFLAMLQQPDIKAVNYWVLNEGTTSLINSDSSLRPVTAVVADFYRPGLLSGQVTNESGVPLSSTQITLVNTAHFTTTDPQGFYQLAIPAGVWQVEYSAPEYHTTSNVVILQRDATSTQNVILTPTTFDWWLRFWLQLNNWNRSLQSYLGRW